MPDEMIMLLPIAINEHKPPYRAMKRYLQVISDPGGRKCLRDS